MGRKTSQSHHPKRKPAQRARKSRSKTPARPPDSDLNTAIEHHQAGRLAEATSLYKQILARQPDHSEALHLLGVASHKEGKIDVAINLINRAIAVNEAQSPYHYNLGCVLLTQGKLTAAIGCFERALALNPHDSLACVNLGRTLGNQGRLDEAAARFRQALKIDSNLADAYENLAHVRLGQGRLTDAQDCFERAMSLAPSHGLAVSYALSTPVIATSIKEQQQQRSRIQQALAQLMSEDRSVEDPVRHFIETSYLVCQGLNDRDLRSAYAALYARLTPSLEYVAPHCSREVRTSPAVGPIRIGLISHHFHDHPIGRAYGGIVANLSREDFRVVLFRFPDDDNEIVRGIEGAADEVVKLQLNLTAARQQIAEQKLDVLLYTDLGLDAWTYFLAFARLAPVQCVAAGHPVTTGIPTIDYFVSTAEAEPEDADSHYSEQLVRLTNDLACLPWSQLPSPAKTRRQFGFDEQTHLYVCPHAFNSFHPDFDRLLGQILRSDPQGRIILCSPRHDDWRELLADRFQHSIPHEVDRVQFHRQEPTDFLHLLRVADVVLDTIYFDAGPTNLYGFALGAPIVTLAGKFLRGRRTHAAYRRMGVLDCVATDLDEYVQIAVRLGTDVNWRIQVRGKILLAKHILFDRLDGLRELEQFLKHAVGRPGLDPSLSAGSPARRSAQLQLLAPR